MASSIRVHGHHRLSFEWDAREGEPEAMRRLHGAFLAQEKVDLGFLGQCRLTQVSVESGCAREMKMTFEAEGVQ